MAAMDDVQRRLEAFRTAPEGSYLEEYLGDPRVVPFLVALVADPDAYDLARIEAMTVLRLWPPADPAAAGRALAAALRDDEDEVVRQHAAMALESYAGDAEVRAVLAAAAEGDDDENVRFNARAALGRPALE